MLGRKQSADRRKSSVSDSQPRSGRRLTISKDDQVHVFSKRFSTINDENDQSFKDENLLHAVKQQHSTSLRRVTSLLAGSDQKKQRLPLWPEWNENDINAEKWEVGGKNKETTIKGKPASAAAIGAGHGFEDPDPKFDYPNGIHIRTESFRRPIDIFEKQPFIVDTDNGLDSFDLITPNEHLHNNEIMRWIISQIHTLWDICKKDPKSSYSTTPSQMLEPDNVANKSLAAGRLWRPWEHIYAMNKVVKGPFVPAYNPNGKYVVRLYFMGAWRKIIIDDLIPVDEKGIILLPQSTISGEIWPMLITKALLKIISLDLNPSDSPTEFNDVSIISCFTGWLPEPLPLRFGHISEVWRFLKDTLPKYQWQEDKPKTVLEDELALINEVSDTKDDFDNNASKLDSKSQKSKGKDNAASVMEIKTNLPSGKDTKLDKHKKGDVKAEKKGKSIFDDNLQEESFTLDFPEMVVYASFTDLPLNKLSASTEVADRRERLRKYNLNHDFSNPVWITCTRDISLNPPPPPDKIPVWKTIRQKKKHIVPSDEPIMPEMAKPDQWIELKSPFVGYKASTTVLHPTIRSNSRYSRIRSRPQSQTNIEGIQEADEITGNLEKVDSNSPTDLNRVKLDVNAESEISSKQKTSLYKANSTVNKREQENTQIDMKPAGSIISSAKDSGKNKQQQQGSETKRENSGVDKNDDDKSNRGSKMATDDYVNPDQTNNTLAGVGAEQIKLEQQKNLENKNKLWMDFDDFFVCFKSIIVYHKPTSYKFNEKYNDLRQVVPQKEKFEKKKDQTGTQTQLAPLFDEKSLKLLFVDSLMPIELIISFSSLSRWYEQKLEIIATSDKVTKSLKKSETIIQEHDTISISEVREILPLQSGSLMAEPYTWKSLVTGQPTLRIHTTSIRSSFLSLPPGRHVLKFVINAPVGYHINCLSNTKFSLGDEEEIMPKLTDESCRFVDQALHIMKCLSEAVRSFSDPQRQKESLDLLLASMSPLTDSYLNKDEDDDETTKDNISKKNLYEIFQASLYEMLRKALNEAADYESAFSWRVFLGDASTPDPFLLKERRPETSSTNRGSAKKVDKKKSEAVPIKEQTKGGDKQSTSNLLVSEKTEIFDEKVEQWKNHTPTANEHIAAVKIQTALRGFYTRQLFHSRIPGKTKNLQITENLRKSLNLVELNVHENALYLFRTMFKINPSIMEYYSFYKDEWNRISYLDFNGSYPDQTSNWLILFRDVFFANEQVLLLPKIYCNLNNCLLRVINNDTYKEIPKVFNKVSPYTYSKNKKGYTIIAEARAQDQPSGRWRLRLIGSSPSLITPKLNKTEIISAFDMKETRDYYIPNDNKTILRYKVTVNEDHMTTLQLNTSKSDVYIKFTIYDNGDEVLSVTGKGCALIPVFMFLKDRGDGTNPNEVQSSSRPASKTFSTKSKIDSNKAENKTKDQKIKRSTSVNSNENKNVHSRSSSRQSAGPDIDDDDQNKSHRYILEAVVLKDSWPLSASNWIFVNKLKEDEINDLKIFKDRVSSAKDSKAADSKNADKKGSKSKEKDTKTAGKNPKDAKTAATSRPASSSFDSTKPHWILKWVSDEGTSDLIEIKKDTDRAEEIKALKRAWENVEAGRAAKAAIARSNFLKSNLVKADGSLATDDESDKQSPEEILPESIKPLAASTFQAVAALVVKPAPPAQPPTAATSVKQSDDQPKVSITIKQRKKEQPSIKPILEAEVKSSNDLLKTEDSLTAPATVKEIVDEILLDRPPTPPKPKVFLPPIDVMPFVKSTNNGILIKKDESFIKEQDKQRKLEVNNFMHLKEQMVKFREEERKYRLYQKLKQIEECEALQSKLDMARKEIIEPREAFRNMFLDAERKRLEDLANQEASLASMSQKPDSKDKKKGSAGKKKK